MSKFPLILIFLCLTINSASVVGQSQPTETEDFYRSNIGIGAGLDYGGLGLRYTYMATPKFGFFGSAGYVLVGLGYNFGLNYKFSPQNRVTPYVTGMYGYNAVIQVKGASQFDAIYYGPSFGFGVEVRRRNNPKNFWNFALIVPIRSSEYKDDVDYLMDNPDIEMTEALPIAFSIGFHFGVN